MIVAAGEVDSLAVCQPGHQTCRIAGGCICLARLEDVVVDIVGIVVGPNANITLTFSRAKV